MTLEGVKQLLDKVADAARIDTVFGESREVAGKTIIPVAKVCYAGGGGGGAGKAAETEGGGGEGSGGGGGLCVNVRPLGCFVVTDEGERWVPVTDISKLAVTGGVVVFGVMWMVKKILTRRRHHD